MSITAVIQARLGSSRLPRKILLPISGEPCLKKIIKIVKQSLTIERIIVICNDDDGSVADICQEECIGLSQYKPPKRDVLSEFWHAKLWDDNDLIVRITADCPLLIPEEIDDVVKSHIWHGADYSYNRSDDTDSEGEGHDVEVMTGRALRLAYQNATNPYDREHCTPFLRNGGFLVNKTTTPNSFGCSLNTKEDYSNILEIIKCRYTETEQGQVGVKH